MNLYLFDGSNLGFRAQCVHPELTTPDGFPTGAIYGVVRILSTFQRDFKVGKMVIPFDFSKSKFRMETDPSYKAHRGGDPRMANLAIKFREQLGVIYDLLHNLGVTVLGPECLGYEADDIIAFIVHCFKQKACWPNITQIIIISSDKDLCALVQPGVVWFNPIKNEIINTDNFVATFGVKPEQYPDFKRLKGDASDGIWHPPGIGEKGAVKMLKEYGSVDEMLKIRHAKLEGHADRLAITKKLIDLDLHQKFPEDPVWSTVERILNLPPHGIEPKEKLVEIFQTLQFDSILEKLDDTYPIWEAYSRATL